MDIKYYREGCVIDGIVLDYEENDFGGRYVRHGVEPVEYKQCLICGAPLKMIRPHDFLSLVCLKHNPPIIFNRPWCNPQSIEIRELHEHEIKTMECYDS